MRWSCWCRVLKEPPVEGAAEDKQAKMDERIAAARSLRDFKDYQATEALAGVLRTDQDVAYATVRRNRCIASPAKSCRLITKSGRIF